MNRKLAYAIPNVFTVASLISGLVALNQAAMGQFVQAAWLITLSLLLDGLDGKMARILNATSKLGAQADSLADFVAFGVVPSFLAWQVGLHKLGIWGFMMFIIYILCGGFRLARFNVLLNSPSKKEDFMGLPIPAGAAAVCSFILFNEKIGFGFDGNLILLCIMAIVSYLMVSKIPYIAVNKGKKRKKYVALICVIFTGVTVLAIHYTTLVYLVGIWIYIVYGLLNRMRKMILNHHEHKVYTIKQRRGEK